MILKSYIPVLNTREVGDMNQTKVGNVLNFQASKSVHDNLFFIYKLIIQPAVVAEWFKFSTMFTQVRVSRVRV